MKTRISKRAGVLGICMMVAVVAMAMAPAQSEAQVIATGVNPNPVLFADALVHFLPINFAATAINFTTTAPNQRVAVFFNAECAVKGTDRNSQVNVNIIIDNVIVPPSVGDDVFCVDLGDNILHNWTRPSMNVWRVVPAAGVHVLRVTAQMFNFTPGVDQYRIDDSSVIVTR